MSYSPGRDFSAWRAGSGSARWPALAVFAVWLLLASSGRARSADVPASVQAALISKTASFDRNFAARAGPRALVIIVQASDDADSAKEAASIHSALSQLPTIGSLPHEELRVTYTGASALAELARTRRAAIVYFGSGLSDQIPAIRSAFSSVNVLTFGSDPDYVPSGIVLGVDLVSGRPKLVVNLAQARKQKVALPASVLRLMIVHQ